MWLDIARRRRRRKRGGVTAAAFNFDIYSNLSKELCIRHVAHHFYLPNIQLCILIKCQQELASMCVHSNTISTSVNASLVARLTISSPRWIIAVIQRLRNELKKRHLLCYNCQYIQVAPSVVAYCKRKIQAFLL